MASIIEKIETLLRQAQDPRKVLLQHSPAGQAQWRGALADAGRSVSGSDVQSFVTGATRAPQAAPPPPPPAPVVPDMTGAQKMSFNVNPDDLGSAMFLSDGGNKAGTMGQSYSPLGDMDAAAQDAWLDYILNKRPDMAAAVDEYRMADSPLGFKPMF